MKKLFLIPARGGSKGLPRKNILPLAGAPMIYYTLDAARGAMEDDDVVCVSTDDLEIAAKMKDYGFALPFIRPESLAKDTTTTSEVVEHALNWYAANEVYFDIVILLQPTSPLRNAKHVRSAIEQWDNSLDLLVSVKETDANPYYVLFEEDDKGYLIKAKSGDFLRRQDCPKVYELNGAIYIFSAQYSGETSLRFGVKTKKFIMDKFSSIDIDDKYDFLMAQTVLNAKNEGLDPKI